MSRPSTQHAASGASTLDDAPHRRPRAAPAARRRSSTTSRSPPRHGRRECLARPAWRARHPERRQLDDQDFQNARPSGQCAAAAKVASGLTARAAAIMPASMRCSASVWPSKRSTSTGVVLELRGSGRSRRRTRRARRRWSPLPFAPGNFMLAAVASPRAGSPSAQGTFSSGVLKLVGRASSTALGFFARDRISSSAPRCRWRRRSRTSARRRRCGRSSRRRWAPDLAHLGLDQRVAGLPHQRHAAGLADGRRRRCVHLTSKIMVRARVARSGCPARTASSGGPGR